MCMYMYAHVNIAVLAQAILGTNYGKPVWALIRRPPPSTSTPSTSTPSTSTHPASTSSASIPSSEAAKTSEGGSALKVISKFYVKGPQPISDPTTPAPLAQTNSVVKTVSEGSISPTLSKVIDAYFADD